MPKTEDPWDFDEIEELLNQLTEAELLELNGDFDPDNSMLPPSQRCKDQTDKDPTGPFSRKKLLKFLEEQAKNEKDWDEAVPYKKETKGKIFVPKKEEKSLSDLLGGDDDDIGDTEWDGVLEQATEEELVDLAAVLGFYSVMNQDQYNASIEGREVEGSFSGVAKATQFPSLPLEPPNNTDVDDAISKLESNDSSLTELNLNNIKNISLERLQQICRALADNKHLKQLHMANTAATDRVFQVLAESLLKNSTLEVLNIESNFMSGDAVVNLLENINEQQTLRVLRIANQRSQTFGVRNEMRIAKLVEDNEKLLALGYNFTTASARIRTDAALQRNKDQLRLERKK